MQKISEYIVVAAVYDVNLADAPQHTKLQAQVNEKIAEGWQPYGAMTGIRGEGTIIFAQPMVKYVAE